MASISTDKNGNRTVQFFGRDPTGRRKQMRHSIRLGKVPMQTARDFKVHLEALRAASKTGTTPKDWVLGWVVGLDDDMHERLAKAGLTQPRHKPAEHTVHELLEIFRARTDVKPATLIVWGHTMRNLRTYFGQDKILQDITAADAEEWQRWLREKQELSSSTLGKRTKFARQFFQYAVKKRWLTENPFQGLPVAGSTNPDRQRFIDRPTTDLVLQQCPDAEWKLIVALSRYGGLRMPSEGLALTWDHIDWEQERMVVPSPKTERFRATRTIPIFPELRPYLDAVWFQADKGQVYVLQKYRRENMRTQLCRFIRRAGLTPWPKPFHNMRASRETELAQQYPLHVACEWIGNTERIALRHYCQVTEDDFRSALQNPMQLTPEHVGMEQSNDSTGTEETPVSPAYSDDFRCLPPILVEPKGLEHLANSPQKTAVTAGSAADSGALSELVRVWTHLPEGVRRQILQLAGLV